MNQVLKFQAPTNSPEFTILSTISGLHVTARQKNIDLLKLLGSKGVGFGDIRNHLMNEAKRVGLWEKGKKISHYKFKGWYVAVQNFLIWKNKNYTNYNVPQEVVKKAKEPIKTRVVVTRVAPTNFKEVPAAGPTNEVPKPVTTNSSNGVNASIKFEPPKEKEDKIETFNSNVITALTRPVEETLTTVQIQTIVFKNISILGSKAVELGAAEEFNELMIAMGLFDEVIQIDNPEILQEVSQINA